MTQSNHFSIKDNFSRFPGGRYAKHGPHSGQEFREKYLAPLVKEAISEGHVIVIDMNGVATYPASFLEEAFGGLVREYGLTTKQIKDVLELRASDAFTPYRDLAWEYIKEAEARTTNH